MMRLIEAEARETADRKAKEIIACSIQRYAGDYGRRNHHRYRP